MRPCSLEPPPDLGKPLTRREAEVLLRVTEGLSNRMIARRLGISEKTVKKHVGAVYAKLGVTCRVEAVLRALEPAHRSGTE
ncbi:response regulator transcription factor [Streptomyces pathocidini]|uniref:Response regulator transcription factor n=1 Tax=Streptomyces pathocidini TaxID=1650571 RepID=A0ABW7UKH8_9ACTN|nr:response regulator transcription factor [Streptomyces pathocidini]